MSLIQHSLFPRSMLDMDEWIRNPINMLSTTLEEFDPFDELDRQLGRNLTWINKPWAEALLPLMPLVPQKYRITVDCSGFSPNSIKTELKDDKKSVVVSGKEDYKRGEDDWSNKEFKKTYKLPENCEPDKMVSFMTIGDKLVLEFPLKETLTQPNADLFPKITDNPDGTKSVSLNFNIPVGIDPSRVNVTLKDRDLILRCEDKKEKDDLVTKFHYYQRTTLPENTNLGALKCVNENNQIKISAPMEKVEHKSRIVPVPIENVQQTQQMKGTSRS